MMLQKDIGADFLTVVQCIPDIRKHLLRIYYSPKSVNNHLSALRCLNKYLVQSGRQSDMAVLDSDFMKVQIQYASPCSVDKKEVEAFRQRMLESGSKRDFAIVTLLVYAGLRRSECVDLKLNQVDLVAKEIRVIGKGDKQRLVYLYCCG